MPPRSAGTAMHVEAMFSPETEGNVREVEGAAHEKGVQLQILKASNEGEIDAPHRPLPRASWGASGGKRTVIPLKAAAIR